ncbi:hypothetical protein OEA41_002095 [Lepraria neglecta]|uniref:Ankyrin n=1 Tax=Lepraria neglecta TaxID=209136 RepID=A0AAD9ZBC0_9LECA|nr:hypothetical protein OEA41_002095 [Lepraria neglecta]
MTPGHSCIPTELPLPLRLPSHSCYVMQLSLSALRELCSTGNLSDLREFLEFALPSLPKEAQSQYHYHINQACSETPCPSLLAILLETAARANQTAIFAYIWDTLFSQKGASIPWQSLRAAALLGSTAMGEVFYARDPGCFKITQPAAVHGPKGGSSQILIAMRHGHLDYVNFMLTHGADINAGGPEHSPVRAAVQHTVDDETSFRRIRFLVERGAKVANSGTLEAAAAGHCQDAVRYLLSEGEVELNDVESAIAAAEKCHRDDVVEILRGHQINSVQTKSN